MHRAAGSAPRARRQLAYHATQAGWPLHAATSSLIAQQLLRSNLQARLAPVSVTCAAWQRLLGHS